MTNWRKFVPTFFVFAIAALCLPVVASAQYGGYGNNGGYNRNDRNNNYDRGLKDAIKRVKDRSGDFRKHLDRSLDRSRINGSNREDQINSLADQFHDAADRLKDSFGNGRNYGNSQQDAQRLVELGDRIDRVLNRVPVDSRGQSDWYQIRGDLSYISNAFGVFDRGNGGYGGYRNGPGRGRNDNGGGRWP